MKSWKDVVVAPEATLKEGIERIDKGGMQLAIVLEPDGRLAGLLSDGEIDALADRVTVLGTRGRFPEPDPYDHPVPWPPY